LGIFFRLLSYSLKYRARFVTGVFISFIVAVLNGLSLTAFIPLFDALGDKRPVFEIQFTGSEREILRKSLKSIAIKQSVPQSPLKIKKELALKLLNITFKPLDYGLSKLEWIRLRTIIRWKLRVNAAGLAPRKVVYTACLIVLPLYSLKLFLLLICVRLIAGPGYMAVRDLRSELYIQTQNLPLTFYYREKTGLLMSRIINDVEIVSAVISSNLRDAITNLFYIATHLLLLAYLNLPLLIISIITVPLILSPVTLFTRKIRKSTSRSQELLADLNAHLQEAISGVRVIRSMVMEKYETEKFCSVNDKFYWRKFKQEFYLKAGPNLVELTSAIVTIGIIALGALFIDQTDFTAGEFIAFLLILLFIIRPIIQLSGMYSKINQSIAAGERIFEIIDMEPVTRDPINPQPVRKLNDTIIFDNISFKYPETSREVLHNIQLSVPAGSTVALVGESGAGKSTLMDLLARFFVPTTGRILIDGIDIQEFSYRDHRSRIGIVTQEIFLFYGTFHENIAFGKSDFEIHEVEKSARLAYAHDFIQQHSQGYDTIIGEQGLTLSGGQRQRIAIARALLRDPEILILDEATSALDTESERLVQQALERLFQNRTTFVIAHRLSTIEKADIIVVISEGRITDMGTHEDLLRRPGLYARLQEISRQTASLVTE